MASKITTVPFDTLKMAERLKKAGFTEQQAKAQTDFVVEVMQTETLGLGERFAAKQDVTAQLVKMNVEIDAFRKDVDAELHRLEQTLLTKIATTASETTRWIVSVGILQGALIAGLVLKLMH